MKNGRKLLKKGLFSVFALFLLLVSAYYTGNGSLAWGGQPEPGANAAAPTVSTPPMGLLYTYMATDGGALGLTTAYTAAFPVRMVTCPVTLNSCTVRIEVSSQFWSVPVGEVARMEVLVDGTAGGVMPASIVNVDSTTTGSWASVRTFSWMKKYLRPGNHFIKVNFEVSNGAAFAGYRTQTIELLTP